MSELESESVAALVAVHSITTAILLSPEKKKKRKRTCWVRPWISRQKKSIIVNLVNNELLSEDPLSFKNYLRMNNDSFEKLLHEVEGYISKQDTVMRECIPTRQKLMISLRFLASGETYRNLMYSTRVHESTIAQFIPTVCQEIYSALKEESVKVPRSNTEWENIAADFYNLWQIPNTIGAIDGKYIACSAPASAGSKYFNYKGYNSIVLVYIDVGVNGRVSDGGVFAQSDLFRAFHENTLDVPPEKPLPGRKNPVPYVLIGNAAFPLKTYLMKPYPSREQTESQSIYNYRARRVVENAFGILSNRFRILLRTISLNLQKVKCITLPCCSLHNIPVKESFAYNSTIQQTLQEPKMVRLGQQHGNHASSRATKIREEFKEYFNTSGAVGWQHQMI